jgi:hypothetical protein
VHFGFDVDRIVVIWTVDKMETIKIGRTWISIVEDSTNTKASGGGGGGGHRAKM